MRQRFRRLRPNLRRLVTRSWLLSRELLRLDLTEGVPGRRYRHIEIQAEDVEGRVVPVETRLCGTSP